MSKLRVGDMVATPHAMNGRLYEVMDLDAYPNGMPRASIREIGTPNDPISYPAGFLTFQGRF